VLHEGWAQHGEPLTRPLPTVVPCSDRDTPGPPPKPVIGTAPDLCLFKPDGDRPRIDCRSWHVEKEPVVIKQAPVKRRNAIKVSFVLPRDAIPGKTSVVGDFNGWDPLAQPLQPRANGTRSAAVTLPPGRRFAFRYLAEGGRWHDDETAEAFEPNGAGGHNAVLHT
jgi:hypothetical protein